MKDVFRVKSVLIMLLCGKSVIHTNKQVAYGKLIHKHPVL